MNPACNYVFLCPFSAFHIDFEMPEMQMRKRLSPFYSFLLVKEPIPQKTHSVWMCSIFVCPPRSRSLISTDGVVINLFNYIFSCNCSSALWLNTKNCCLCLFDRFYIVLLSFFSWNFEQATNKSQKKKRNNTHSCESILSLNRMRGELIVCHFVYAEKRETKWNAIKRRKIYLNRNAFQLLIICSE